MDPNIEIREAPISQLADLANISCAFRVDRRLEASPSAERPGKWVFAERSVDDPVLKDYDSLPDNHPLGWARQFDLGNWGLIFAHQDGKIAGGALLAWNTSGVEMLEGRSDLAVLWDIRVAPEQRSKGIGAALFTAAKKWSLDRGCRELKIETQNNNAAAVRFYLSMGCTLRKVVHEAYPGLPGEAQLLFYHPLQPV